MASSLAAQLAQIAVKSKAGLDIKAQKSAHSKSLIWEPRDAAAQSFQSIYTKCIGSFEELCSMDDRFTPFGLSLFSEASQSQDRIEMTTAENAQLDKTIDAFLHLLGSRLRLQPAIGALEWLVRRFKVHDFNTATLIMTFLPYHTTEQFRTLMSILPANIPPEHRYLDPYIRQLVVPPRGVIVREATNRPEFLSAISRYTLESCRTQTDYPALVGFWGGVMTQAVNGMLDKGRTGNRALQADNDQVLLQQVLPTLSEALVAKAVPDMQVAGYTVVSLLAAKGQLDDGALAALMDQVVYGWTRKTLRTGLVCLSILAHYRSAKALPVKVTKALLKVQDLTHTLKDIGQTYKVGKLSNGLALASVDRLTKKGDARGLPVVKSLLLGQILPEKQVKVIYKALLIAAYKVTDELDQDGRVRKELGSILVTLSQSAGTVGDVIRATLEEVDFDIEELELKLETTIRPLLTIEPTQEAMEITDAPATLAHREQVDTALARISSSCPKVNTCLASEPSDMFMELCSLFLSVASGEADLATFDSSPLLGRSEASGQPFYISFYARVWCGPYPTLARALALEKVKDCLKENGQGVDFQALLPFCLAALGDPAKKVRRAAADLVTVLNSLPASQTRWGSKGLYEGPNELVWLDSDVASAFTAKVILPALEEAVLHTEHMTEIVKAALEGTLDSGDSDVAKSRHLTHARRLAILKFLSSHAIHVPLLSVKQRLLKPLNHVRSISGTSRTQLLLLLLRWWVSLDGAEARRLALRESIDEPLFDAACIDIVAVNDKVGLEFLLDLVKNPLPADREHLAKTIFSKFRKMWPTMKESTQLATAKTLLDLVHTNTSPSPDQWAVSAEAAGLLSEVPLSTSILFEFLASLDDITQMTTQPPVQKRRRASASDQRNPAQKLEDKARTTAARNKASLVLSLVQESNPASHPELLESLFTTLSNVQHLATISGSESGHLVQTVLDCLNKMMPAYRSNKDLKIDASVGHGDLLATCIQKSSSPSVINEALLLVASLARIAPDVVLHSVMPIFTFMGGSLLKRADEYSAFVVKRTITEVIPPLIDTFRKSRRGLVASASEVLSSFVVAYEHIPSHRKQDIFISLVENLGPAEFLFAVLAMFVDRYGTTDNIVSFLLEMVNAFPIDTQLQTLVKIVDLVGDVLKPKPTLGAVLMGKNENGDNDVQKSALKLMTILPRLLSSSRLRTEIGKLAKQDDMEAGKIRDLYATLLEDILALAAVVKGKKALYARCEDALGNLLNLLSVTEFIKSVETLLNRPNITLRQKVLRALELRVDRESISDAESRTALLAFLPQLTAVIRESDDNDYKRTAVICVDKIADKYGKKDLEAVAAAAETIASDDCLGQPVERLRVMALLCLASLVDVLQDSIVPVLPSAIPKALDYLQLSVEAMNSKQGSSDDTTHDIELHNASYAFITSLTQHLPFMISDKYLDRILASSSLSAAAELNDEASTNRRQCLQFLARLVDPKTIFSALERNWRVAAKNGYPAIAEYLEILGTSIDKHPKAAISKNIKSLSSLCFAVFDLRREAKTNELEAPSVVAKLNDVEATINEVVLKMIYKLNDATFRPVFSELIEWAATGLPKSDSLGRTLRQESVYSFLATFFGNLKSIVTSYASYVFEGAADVLKAADVADAEEQELWRRVLSALSKSFEHDQDTFWQAPAHFGAVAPVLVEQFLRAGVVDTQAALTPAVVELAAAADSREHHKDLNTALLRLLRHEDAAVRVGVIRAQQALTERLGEEWLQTLPEMLPYISELQDDDDEEVERENRRWIVRIEETLGENLDAMLQ